MRRLLTLVAALAAAPAAAAPDYIPDPRQQFDGFSAINAPRPDVPVGALWIDGYGPTGSAAEPDNLETVRSLNGITISSKLQLSLTAGLLDLLGIDPHLRNQYSARFTDLTIIRVKDIGQLEGPAGEPRIVEALKAGSITVSTDSDIGLGADEIRRSLYSNAVPLRTDAGRTRGFSIDGRDLFIAIRVATQKDVASDWKVLDLEPDKHGGVRAQFAPYAVRISDPACLALEPVNCATFPQASLGRTDSIDSDHQPVKAFAANRSASLILPVPRGDGQGGLYTRLELLMRPACDVLKAEGCARRPRLVARLRGERLEAMDDPKAKGW